METIKGRHPLEVIRLEKLKGNVAGVGVTLREASVPFDEAGKVRLCYSTESGAKFEIGQQFTIDLVPVVEGQQVGQVCVCGEAHKSANTYAVHLAAIGPKGGAQ